MTTIGHHALEGWDAAGLHQALAAAGYPDARRPGQDQLADVAMLILFIMMHLCDDGVRPDRRIPGRAVPDPSIRYTSMSLPYHIGNGWFGGMLPLLATAMVAWSGNIYYGLWYPIIVAVMTAVIGALFLRETKNVDIRV